MKKIILILPYLIIIFMLIFYFITNKNKTNIINEKYNKKIDSLENLNRVNSIKIDSINFVIDSRYKKIDSLNSELKNLNKKYLKNIINYEKNITRINGLSNDDLTSEFTNTFK